MANCWFFNRLVACHSSPSLYPACIQTACELLQQGDRLISEVARESGFSGQSSSTQHFRRHLGMTPRRYRQQYRLVRG